MVTLHGEGYSMRKISRKLKVSLCAVQSILAKKEETGSARDKGRSGRPRVTNGREDGTLIRLSLSNRTVSSKMLKRQYQDATGSCLSTRTIRRLLKAGFKGCVVVKKPLLTAKHRKSRLRCWRRRAGNGKRQMGENSLFS